MTPWQVLGDCPHCRTESALVEDMDPHHPATHFGVPSRRQCQLCTFLEEAAPPPFVPARSPVSGRCPNCDVPLSADAREGRGGCGGCQYRPVLERIRDPLDLSTAAAAGAALGDWAAREGHDDVDVFCLANMGVDRDTVVEMLVSGTPVATSLDVIAFLFPGSAVGASFGEGTGGTEGPRTATAPTLAPPPEMDRHLPGRVLVSVMVADGALKRTEQRFVSTWLDQHGWPAPDPSDRRVWRPGELGPRPDPEVRDPVLQAAVRLMHLDGERDDSVWRVITTYAAAWGLSPTVLAGWDRRFARRSTDPLTWLGNALVHLLG